MRSEYRLGRGTCSGPQASAARPDFIGRNLSTFGETIGGVDVLRRLRAEWPEDKLIVVWDGASYHRACVVREAAEALQIDLVPLPGYIHADRGALALAPGGCHLSLLPSHRRGSQPPGGRFRNTPQSGRLR